MRDPLAAAHARRQDPFAATAGCSSAQPSFIAPAFIVHRYLLLSFPSKIYKMFVI